MRVLNVLLTMESEMCWEKLLPFISVVRLIESSDLAACEYHIESQAMCGAIDPIKYTKFYLNFFET
jgi:hypothetical protein